jgi:pantoate--beta-alanine ligase
MIKVLDTRLSLDQFRRSLSPTISVGLVPTMGNLHAGHLTLLEKSCEENDLTIITIFVNPKQFGPTEDFAKYPRTLDQDLEKIANLNLRLKSKIIIFAPKDSSEIFPENFSTSISVGAVTQLLCGKFRPTHFDGVTTVVYRLFKIANASNAYFGQKDFQQCVIIQKMVEDLEIPIKLHIMPIIRNSEGLALSSRNQYLTDVQKVEALHLPETLIKIEKMLIDSVNPKSFIEIELQNKAWDYLEILDAKNLNPSTNQTKEVVIIGAYRQGSTRLLDNRVVKINA